MLLLLSVSLSLSRLFVHISINNCTIEGVHFEPDTLVATMDDLTIICLLWVHLNKS